MNWHCGGRFQFPGNEYYFSPLLYTTNGLSIHDAYNPNCYFRYQNIDRYMEFNKRLNAMKKNYELMKLMNQPEPDEIDVTEMIDWMKAETPVRKVGYVLSPRYPVNRTLY